MNRRIALIRRPGSRLADGQTTHIERSPIDLALAFAQWEAYAAALRSAGWETIEVPPADDCPDAVFVEDVLVVYGDLAVVTRPGHAARLPEIDGMAEVVAGLGLGYRVAAIEAPGTLDGGDVLKHDGTVWVGLGGRTNEEGVRQLAELLKPLGATVIGVPLTKVLHLKSAVTALPDGTVVGLPDLVDDTSVWSAFRAVGEEPGSHVVLLGDRRLLMSASARHTGEAFEEEGWEVTHVEISEFEKLEGCVTCLSVRLRG